MTALYRMVPIVDGETVEPVQYVGVYTLRWGDGSLPTVAFVEAEPIYQRIEELLDLIRDVEWVPDYITGSHCPWCQGHQHDGHKPNCPRQAVLAIAERKE